MDTGSVALPGHNGYRFRRLFLYFRGLPLTLVDGGLLALVWGSALPLYLFLKWLGGKWCFVCRFISY